MLGEVGEQQVEVREPGVRLPVVHGGGRRVVERLSVVEPARKVVAGADIVAGEDMQPTKAAQGAYSVVQRPTPRSRNRPWTASRSSSVSIAVG